MDSPSFPSISFPTDNPNSNISTIYSQQLQQLNDYFQLFDQPLQMISSHSNETEERNPKVAKSAVQHTSPNHIETAQRTQHEETTSRSDSIVPKDQCPICSATVTPDTFEAHYKSELAKLDEITADSAPISIESEITTNNSSRNKREAALFARKKVQKQMDTQSKGDAANPLEVLKAVRQNRTSRRKDKGSPIATHSTSRKSKTPSQECPICFEKLQGGLDEINAHIDSCLGQENGTNKKPKKSTSKRKTRANKEEDYQDENVETYTWGGVTRVRTCSLLENGYTGLFGACNSKASAQEDEAELDIENDEISKFGASQYSETDLIIRDEEEEDTKKIRERVTGANSDTKTKANVSMDIQQATPDEVSSTSTDTNGSLLLLVEALKEKVREQESRLANSFKCLICMESYQKPLVSVNCWHVHCEKCWLSSLGVMKLCPQCKVITSPSDLRKIFL